MQPGKVTVFKNIFEVDDPMFVDVVEVFKRIKDGNSKEIIQKIRASKDKDYQNEIKKRLPSICFSGRFGKREAEHLLEHSGLICLDIDDIKADELLKVKELIVVDDYVMSCFVSPSGLGLKIIIKITDDKSHHKGQFLALEQHFNKKLSAFVSTKKKKGETLNVCIDKSGKDINRVCYESWDESIYFNPDSEVWYEILEEVLEEKEVQEPDLIIDKLQIWIDKKESYYKGNRNQFLYQFASAMCRYGVSEYRALSYLQNKYDDYPHKEMLSTVKGAYKANDFGTEIFTEQEKRAKTAVVKINDNKPVTAFWSINDKGRVNIDSKQFLKFIESNGFGIYRQNRGDEKWVFVHVENMIVDIVTVVEIKRFVLDYIEKHAPDAVFNELQMKNRYFENTFLNALPLINVEQIRDKIDSSFIFFDGFYYQITAENISKHDYIDLKGRHIWRKHLCKRTITDVVNYELSDFNKFVFNAMGKDINKYKSACSAIGYAIHTYKKKSLAKLIYASDDSLGQLDDMACGGSGKELMMECLKFVRSVTVIDGKEFIKTDKFKFQTVTDDTQIVLIDDYENDIKELFTKITGHFEIEKKSIKKESIEFENSPKIICTSNNSPKGYSSSYARRLHLLEFSNHYSHEHRPIDEFGNRDFFSDDWNQDDYNALYSFLFDAVKYYLKNGLKQVVNESSENRQYIQLVKNCGRDFADYMVDVDLSKGDFGRNVYSSYKTETGDDISIQMFYTRLRKMCAIYGWKLSDKGKGIEKEIKIIKK